MPIGTGELRRIHSRVSWMFLPVERSMTVSAPQRVDQVIFSTSSSIEEVTAELPMFALILTRKFRPIAIGSDSGWLMLAGMIARPRATSSRTNSAARPSRIATNSISGVISPFFAKCICVTLPRPRRTSRGRRQCRGRGRSARRGTTRSYSPRARIHGRRSSGSPADRSIDASGSVYGPDVS